MLVRTLVTFAIFATIGNGLIAQESKPSVNVGDHFVVRMTGELAREWARRAGTLKQTDEQRGLFIESTATVAQKLDNGRFRIEHSSQIKIDNKPSRMITFTTIVEQAKFTSNFVPKNTTVYSSPADLRNGVKPTFTQDERRTTSLELSELKGLKLQTWELTDEIGD